MEGEVGQQDSCQLRGGEEGGEAGTPHYTRQCTYECEGRNAESYTMKYFCFVYMQSVPSSWSKSKGSA